MVVVYAPGNTSINNIYFVSHTWHAGRPAKFLVRIAPTNPRLTLNLTLSLSLTLTMALTLPPVLTLTSNQVLWLFFRQPSMLTHTPRRSRAVHRTVRT